jgi:hypothetical protein
MVKAKAAAKSSEDLEADARGLSGYLHLRLHPALMEELRRVAELERRPMSNLGRHALEIGLKFYSERHPLPVKPKARPTK